MYSQLPLATAFDPATDGFQFSNKSIEWEIHPGSVVGKNLCGGMIYAALDFFLNSAKIPADTTPPARRTPLNNYIHNRQINAHMESVPRLVFGSGWFVDSLAGEFDKIRKKVESGFPAPLFLVKDGLAGHHVLAIGCQSSPSSGSPVLDIYDPNYPNEITTIRAEYTAKRFTKRWASGNSSVRGFFLDTGYKSRQPPV